jgi:hypothetical protein
MTAQYADGNGNWHSEYIAKTKTMSSDQLLFIARDCKAALAANPDNLKASQYADEMLYCISELADRNVVDQEDLMAAKTQQVVTKAFAKRSD